MRHAAPLLALAAALAIAGCSQKPAGSSLDAMDNELVNGNAIAEGNDSLRSAITVDPKRAKAGAAEKPTTGATAGAGNCLQRYGPTLAFSNAWAAKLPVELPVHPQATLTEAAGHDGGCAVRVASFTVPGDRAPLLDWYAGKARAAGYGADRSDRGSDVLLAGSKGPATYTVIAGAPRGGVTPVDLVWARAD